MQSSHSREVGAVHPLLISSILLGIIAVVLAGFAVWAFTNYVDYRDNANAKIEAAVTKAKDEQSKTDEKSFLEREKQPYVQFTGPDDYGHVTFSYPKTWSQYVADSGAKGDGFKAYLNPVSVPAVSNDQAYAIRVEVTNDTYEDTLTKFQKTVEKGDLKSSQLTVNGFTGIRLDGNFSKTRSGSAVVFKVRDKSLIISTDSPSFKGDFDNIVIKSLDFNP